MQYPNLAGRAAALALALGLCGPAAAEEALSQQELNYGYASLYSACQGLRHSDKIFLIKFETDAVEKAVKDLSRSMDAIGKALEELAKADPKLKLDKDGMPVIETRKRDRVTRGRLLSFKPVAGRTGKDFERTLLLSESAALNQLQALAVELDESDPDARRSAFLKETRKTLLAHYDEIVDLLNREYFR
jgi:hypothetical protein